MRLVYLVHDLGDPAVARRLVMLRNCLASAVVIGFHRGPGAPATIEGWPAISLGRTADGRLGKRILSVAGVYVTAGRLRTIIAGATVLMARQLEMLVLATTLARRFARSAMVAYECLDVHRLMVARSPVGHALRLVEGRLLRATDMVIVSSNAFVSAYLRPVHDAGLPPVCLIENKILGCETVAPVAPPSRRPGPPWRIGWYGVLRCKRSLTLLADLARALPGQVLVELRGRPSRTAIPDFDRIVAAAPGLSFHGPYDRRTDLAALYGGVHFAWAVDFYEDGANSQWLLPNRLYEGGFYGAVPIAVASVETGYFLARAQAGVLLDGDAAGALLNYFSTLTKSIYAHEAARLAAIPRASWVDDGQDGTRLAALLQPSDWEREHHPIG